MTFNPKGLIVTLIGILFFTFALSTKTIPFFDHIVGLAIAVIVVVMSIAVVGRMIRQRSAVPYGHDSALREIRRWFR